MKMRKRPFLLALLLSTATMPVLLAQAPRWVEIEPNAIQDPEIVMAITVGGISQGETVLLQILRDCDGDGEPDRTGRGDCLSPLHTWISAKAGEDRIVVDQLDFQALDRAGTKLPRNTGLWLWVSYKDPEQELTARFGLVDDACSLWRTVVDAFLDGQCDPHLAQALHFHLGPSDPRDATFEVRRLPAPREAPAAEPEPSPVPGTRGAMGVAWRDAATLLVTVVAAAVPGADAPRPALLEVPLATGEPRVLWSAPPGDELLPTAPLALPGGGGAFVRQRTAERETEEPAAYLHIRRQGQPEREIALGYRIHQLVGRDGDGRRLLALTLGFDDNHPGFLEIDLETGGVQYLGYHHALYHAALRSPTGGLSVIAFEDNLGANGWDLALVDDHGQLLRELQSRAGADDLLPAWSPAGGEVAYLAEVVRGEETP